MKAYLATASLVCLIAATPALAQTATGIGAANSESNSASGAIAVNRGNGNSNSSLTVNNPANTRSDVNSTVSGTTTSNINQRVSGSTRTENVVSGTQTVKNVPSMVAPGLAAAGLETCLGSASGGVSAVGFGISGGSTYKDEDCTARLDARTLYSMGLKAASVVRLCTRPDIWRSMPDICQRYWPAETPLPYGIYVAAPVYTMSANSGVSTSGAIRVVDGRDGVEKDCSNYSYAKQKCYHWTGESARVPVRLAATSTHKPKPKVVAVSKPAGTEPPPSDGSSKPSAAAAAAAAVVTDKSK